MNFIQNIFDRLVRTPERPVLVELRPAGNTAVTGKELLARIASARAFFTKSGLRKGDRCALIAPNGISWAAFDLAAMACGVIVVPLYARQAPAELAAMIRDCEPRLICCADNALRVILQSALSHSPDAPDFRSEVPIVLLEEVVGALDRAAASVPGAPTPMPPIALDDNDPITIIYTSGTSGEAKGVVLTLGNVNHMLGCTGERLDRLMMIRTSAASASGEPDRVFHYLPFCFAGSWILLLSCLSRNSVLQLSTDLARLSDDLRVSAPNYCLNVPALLERIRGAVEAQLSSRGLAGKIFVRAKKASLARHTGSGGGHTLSLALAQAIIFPAIRKKFGANLKALICGSAPLALETQLFFIMIGIPVLQVYGLTETTAICTMDDPRQVEPGAVGPAISGVEMKLGESGEVLVKGPNVFPGYWRRPEETAKVLSNGWFHTGDQGEQTPSGNWRIVGRLKSLLILNSGHNIAPEPLEDALLRVIPGAQQVVLFGNARSYLAALVTGSVAIEKAEQGIAAVNSQLPHYRQIRAFHLDPQPLTIESGLLTANGKLRRDAIASHFREAIENMYRKPSP